MECYKEQCLELMKLREEVQELEYALQEMRMSCAILADKYVMLRSLLNENNKEWEWYDE